MSKDENMNNTLKILYERPNSDESFIEIMERSILNSAIALELGAYQNEIDEQLYKHIADLEGGCILKEKLPIYIDDKKESKLETIGKTCENCGNIPNEETMYGKIDYKFNAVYIKAVSYCVKCEHWSLLNYRIKEENNSFVVDKFNNKGFWIREESKSKNSFLNKITNFFS